MNRKYVQPRIKTIYPSYRLDDQTFRIGAQRGITTEFGDPYGQLWKLVTYLDGRPLSNIIDKMTKDFPELSEEDVIDGINILNDAGMIEETFCERKNEYSDRYNANINYFSRYTNINRNRYDIQQKINQSTILLLGLGGGGSNILTMLAGLGPKK